jgi:hypothetical protein
LSALRRYDALLVRYLAVLIEISENTELLHSPYAKLFGVEAESVKRSVAITDKKIVGGAKLCRQLSKLANGNEALVYRDLAIFCEENGEWGLAYRLMKEEKKIRTEGPFITKKLLEYEEKITAWREKGQNG